MVINYKNKSKIIICTFLFSIILCGAVSATTTINFSSDGKNITITPNNVPSTLKTSVSSTFEDGIYGYGTYANIKVTGQNNQGINTYSTFNSYNTLTETVLSRCSSVDGFSIENENIALVNNQYVMKMNGKYDNITF